MTDGWIALHRRILDHWVCDKPYNRLAAWIDILLTVNWKDEKVVIGNRILVCRRGESLRSLDTWAERWGWNKSATRRFLKMLQSDSMILLKNETQTTRLTVCNYESYQEVRNASETQVKRKRNADETQMTPNEQVNKLTREQEENTGADANAPLPVVTIQTNDKQEYPITQNIIDTMQELYPAVNVAQEFRNMKAWSISNPSKRKTWGGMMRFVNGWLAREQNKGGNATRKNKGATNGRTYTPDPKHYEQLADKWLRATGADTGAGDVSHADYGAVRGGGGEAN